LLLTTRTQLARAKRWSRPLEADPLMSAERMTTSRGRLAFSGRIRSCVSTPMPPCFPVKWRTNSKRAWLRRTRMLPSLSTCFALAVNTLARRCRAPSPSDLPRPSAGSRETQIAGFARALHLLMTSAKTREPRPSRAPVDVYAPPVASRARDVAARLLLPAPRGDDRCAPSRSPMRNEAATAPALSTPSFIDVRQAIYPGTLSLRAQLQPRASVRAEGLRATAPTPGRVLRGPDPTPFPIAHVAGRSLGRSVPRPTRREQSRRLSALVRRSSVVEALRTRAAFRGTAGSLPDLRTHGPRRPQ
jgi:hypothetical protein